MDDLAPLNVPLETHQGAHRYAHVVGTSVWVHDRPMEPGWAAHFIGLVSGTAWWAVDVPHGVDPSDGAAVDLYGFHGRSSQAEWLAAGRVVQIVEWARTHRFCGRCGTPTRAAPGERAMQCPDCGLLAYPRVAPAMITLVTRGEPGPDQEALLARGMQWRMPMYSCLAGFVEPGESLEAAVHREVAEEVGITVANATYRASQPWPVPPQSDGGVPGRVRERRDHVRPDRDRRCWLVPARSVADGAAWHLDRSAPHRRLGGRVGALTLAVT